jgi:hypothetical protein
MSDYHPAIQALEAKFAQQREGVRQMLYSEGRPDLVVGFDRKMHEIDTGIEGARRTWESISDAQRSVLRDMAEYGGHLWQDPNNLNRFHLRVALGAVIRVRRATVRALASRELLAWEGGAFAPEAKAMLTERGLFVLRHGSPAP